MDAYASDGLESDRNDGKGGGQEVFERKMVKVELNQLVQLIVDSGR